ncbi:hypothetical protein FWJ33_13390 [Leptospira interrogans serovar Hardjo]|nr:hypothetical protein FWJ33_13390 [Leptospira interrogans serovar Hardjo]
MFCDHDQNLNPILTRVWLRKNFLKVVVPTISEIVYKIVICSSPGPTHFTDKSKFCNSSRN